MPQTRSDARLGRFSSAMALAIVVSMIVLAGMGPAVAAATAAGATGGAAPEEPTPGLRMQAARIGHTATLLDDGSVLLAGNFGSDGANRRTERYRTGESRFEPAGSLRQARVLHTATKLPDGHVLILGGWRRKARRTAELYDPESDRFEVVGRLRAARFLHTATLLDDGRVLVIGGQAAGDSGSPLASAELFDPTTTRSRRTGALRRPRISHTATRLEDGTVLVIGGTTKGMRAVAAAELYDPASGRFATVGRLGHPRWLHTATLLADGRVLVVGGIAGRSGPVAAAEVYDPETKTFAPASSLHHLRASHTGTLLDDGRVLVAGGDLESNTLEVFDPASGSLIPAGSLHVARSGHRATKLPDGTVLITGGSGVARPLDSAELFDATVMDVVAFGPSDPALDGPDPTQQPLPPLGGSTAAGRVAMTGSGFEITLPDDWMVEVADPDPDVFGAAPGEAWEALRAFSPERTMACSVSVGVATVSLRKRSGMASGPETVAPRWDESERGTLVVPDARAESGGGGETSTQMPIARLHRGDPDLEHDVLYAVSCSATGDARLGALERRIDGIMETFAILSDTP